MPPARRTEVEVIEASSTRINILYSICNLNEGTEMADQPHALPRLACALPPSARFPEYAKIAEGLGYSRVWAFDSPALYGDVWVALARAADATETIELGTGVAVPFSRHPMVTASAIVTIAELAPGRLCCALGTGFSAAKALGRKPMAWT